MCRTSHGNEDPNNDGAILDAVIIGSGFGGICQAIKLREAGIHEFVVLEKESDLGGTWRDNTYPGAECDVPSVVYSYSFEAKQEYETYLGQAAILDYLRVVADKHDVTRHIRYGQKVDRLSFDEGTHTWEVHTAAGDDYRARFVVSAVGQLHHPKIPKFEGADRFQGTSLHTAQFRSRETKLGDFVGKRVAVIGTGASAIQLVPELQQVCERLHVYQRTPSHVLPKMEFSRLEERIIKTHPVLVHEIRSFFVWFTDLFIFGAFEDRSWWGAACKTALTSMCFWNARVHVKDEKKRAALVARHPIGAKRLLASDLYYPAIDQPNVQLHTDGIRAMTDRGILHPDGSVTEVDAVVLATGFVTHPFLYGISVVGPSGRELWSDGEGSRGYLGVATAGFPNLFFLYGPNTNTNHSSVVLMLEAQAGFVVRAMRHAGGRRNSIGVRASAEDAFNEELQRAGRNLAFHGVKDSWYLHEGKLVNNWTGSARQYIDRLSEVDLERDFEFGGEKDSSDAMPSGSQQTQSVPGGDVHLAPSGNGRSAFLPTLAAIARFPIRSVLAAYTLGKAGLKLAIPALLGSFTGGGERESRRQRGETHTRMARNTNQRDR